MCKYHVYDYASCRHNELIRKERCWQDQVDGCFSCFSLYDWLYPSGTHCKVTIHTTMTGSCRYCDEHQRNSTRRNYGNFITQPIYGVGSSQETIQTQVSDYSCGGLNERPVRAPERSYQPGGYRAQDQMSYPSPQQREPGSSQIPSYGYARRLHRARFVSQPSRLQSPSNRQNHNRSANNFSDPSPYELQVSLNNNGSVRSVSEHQDGTGDDTDNSRSERPRRHARRGRMDVMDRLPRPAPEPVDGERPPVHNRVAALRGERRAKSSRSRSPIDRSQAVSPLTESDLRAPFVPIPEYDEYPERPPYI
ncbi:hypothetical protein FSPOR_3918 [Fusarium sporotrichioides]|uniref:Uncharacterized protein n=1 Tax=Fusarium sporotrichioides TaxID=5514 RepID=A0A395SEN0_FUSSP|nr:hypothetical protein FSPOR_3918 [Fusarium sporotrichioides]